MTSSVHPNEAHRDKTQMRSAKARAGMLMFAPAALYLLFVELVPIGYAFYLSLTNYNPLSRGGPVFQGLANYQAMLSSPEFWSAFRVTVQYVLEVVPAVCVLALGLALLMNRPLPGIGLFRAVFYLPRVVPLATVSLVWLWMYSRDGFLNYLGSFIGFGDVPWLSSPDMALHSLAAMLVWKALGGNMILFLAGLQTISRDLYEAARIDGAGAWSRFVHVTLPGIRPVLLYVGVMNIIYLFQSFTEIYLLTGGGPVQSTTTIEMLIYKQAFSEGAMGRASATSFLLFATILAFVMLALRLSSTSEQSA